MKRKALSLFALFIMVLTIMHVSVMMVGAAEATIASGECGDNLTWTLYESGELVIGGIGNMDNWDCVSSTMPWYDYTERIYTVSIEDGVESIGDYAFFWCDALKSIKIPDSVKEIGDYAFFWCNALVDVTIPCNVTNIGDFAFCDCSSLTSINVHIDNPDYSSSDGVLFNKDLTTLLCYPAGRAGEYRIPYKTTVVGNCAFYACKGLTEITMPNNVTSIGEWAFYKCGALTDVYFIGLDEEWKAITTGSNNENLSSVNLHFVSEKMIGDVNGDNSVNIIDVIRLLKHVNNSEPLADTLACDINGDGIVNIQDIMRLLKHVNNSLPLN